MSYTCKHGRTSPGSIAFLIHAGEGCEYIFIINTGFSGFIQLVCKDIEHDFTIALGINVTVGIHIQETFQCSGIDEIPVMGEADSIGRINVKWLRLRVGATPGCWVA